MKIFIFFLLSIPAVALDPLSGNAKRLGGKQLCTSLIVSNCVVSTDSTGASTGFSSINSAITYYVAPASLSTCTYNGDGGTSCTPSDSNACTTKALPCSTIAGARAKIAGKILNAVVTIQLANTSTSCYQPSDVHFDNPGFGGNYSTALAAGDGGIADDNYPAGHIYIVGDTTTPTNVNIVGAATCAGTTSSTLNGLDFHKTNVRFNGVQFKYFKFGIQAQNSLVYLENVTAVSDNPAPATVDASLAFVDTKSVLKFGAAINVTNWIAFTVNGLSLLDSHTPAGYPTFTYTSSGGERAILINEMSHMYLNGGTWSFAGTGTYSAFEAIEFSSINWNDGTNATQSINAANATWLRASQNSSISEACGSSTVTCTFTALGSRANSTRGSWISFNGSTSGTNGTTTGSGSCIASGTFPGNWDCGGYNSLAIGTTNASSGYNFTMYNSSMKLQRDGAQLQVLMNVAGAQAFHSAVINAQRARGSVGAEAAPQAGDDILSINGTGYDTTAYNTGTNITLEAAGTWSSSSWPSRILMSTTAASSTTMTERVRIPEDGGIRVLTGTKPTCDSSHEFTFFTVHVGANTKSTVEVCAMDASNVYAWRTIY